MTREELGAIRAAAGRKGAEATRRNGTWNGGRPKAENKVRCKVITVHEEDYLRIASAAKTRGSSLVEVVHSLALMAEKGVA